MMKSHKVLIMVALAFTVWYHLKKKAQAAPADQPETDMSSVEASQL